jgi:hypothetical protein
MGSDVIYGTNCGCISLPEANIARPDTSLPLSTRLLDGIALNQYRTWLASTTGKPASVPRSLDGLEPFPD